MTLTSLSPSTATPDPPALRAKNIAKHFGATRAIRDASIEIHRGEVHAILGENGSGKSTLVKVLAGIQPADHGEIEFSPAQAPDRANFPAHRAVVLIFQEVLIATGMSVLDNVWLGSDKLLRSRIPREQKIAEATALLEKLCGRPVDLHGSAGALALSDQQAVCIARALARRPDVLLLDESTSALDMDTRDRLFNILRDLCSTGMSAVFISHRMDEILAIADRTTVMRSGETIRTVDRVDATAELLVSLMTGKSDAAHARERSEARPKGSVVLSSTDLRLRDASVPFDIAIRAGEIVAIAGLEGHGQQHLLLSLAGYGQSGGTVTFSRPDRSETSEIRNPYQAYKQGIVYVPRDRRKASVFAGRSIADNFAIATLGRDSRASAYSNKSARNRLQEYRERMRIRMGSPDAFITTLSGGNQQKVVLARWLATNPAVLLLNDPTRGVDLGAKRDIHQILRDLAADGTAVVVVSSEVEEILQLADRCLVMREGTISAELDRDSLHEDRLVAAYFGEEVTE